MLGFVMDSHIANRNHFIQFCVLSKKESQPTQQCYPMQTEHTRMGQHCNMKAKILTMSRLQSKH